MRYCTELSCNAQSMSPKNLDATVRVSLEQSSVRAADESCWSFEMLEMQIPQNSTSGRQFAHLRKQWEDCRFRSEGTADPVKGSTA
jgi:hypothetical protein